MTSEVKKRYIEKLHLPGNEQLLLRHQENQRIHQQKYRQKQLEDPKTAEAFRKRKAAASRRGRANKLRQELQAKLKIGPGYGSKSGLRRAVKKIEEALPTNRERAIEAIKIVCKNLDLKCKDSTADDEDDETTEEAPVKIKKPRKSFIGTTELVHQFYELDSTSRLLPDDFTTIDHESGVKIKFQKRVMLMPVHEVYKNFQSKYQDRKISSSKFHQLRPAHIDIAVTKNRKTPQKVKEEDLDDY